jgi:hypothetical protein
MDIAAVIKASCRQEVKIQAIVRVLHQAVHLFDCFPSEGTLQLEKLWPRVLHSSVNDYVPIKIDQGLWPVVKTCLSH